MMTTELLGYLADPMAEARCKQQRIARKKKTAYFIRQRFVGLVGVLLGIIVPTVLSILIIPFGIAMLVSKDMMVTDDYSLSNKN